MSDTHGQIKTDAEMVRCLCWHRRWLHEGRSMSCTMAACQCHLFVERVEDEAENKVSDTRAG
jgi:hypothetical protein